MRPIRLVIDGINSFRTRQTLDFSLLSSELFCVCGDTGAGKSTVLDAMILALYGECNRGDDVRGRDFVNLERDKAEVEFEFVMEGARYHIWREFAADVQKMGVQTGGGDFDSEEDCGQESNAIGGAIGQSGGIAAQKGDGDRIGGLDLGVNKGVGIVSDSGVNNGAGGVVAARGGGDRIANDGSFGKGKSKKAGEPKKRVRLYKNGELVTAQPTEAARIIEEVVGLNRHDFTQVVVLEQGRFSRFLSSSRKERSTTVSKLLKLDRFKDLYSKTDSALSVVKNKKENIESSVLAYAGHTLDAQRELEKSLKEFEEKSDALDRELERVSAESRRLDALKMEFEGAQKAEARKSELLPQISVLKTRIVEAEKELAACVLECGEARKQRDKLAIEHDRLVNLLPRQTELLECGQQLETARKKYAEQKALHQSFSKRAEEVRAERKECGEQLEKLTPQLFGFLGEIDVLSAKTAAAAVTREYARSAAESVQIRGELEKCEGAEKSLTLALVRYQNDMDGFVKTHSDLIDALKNAENNYEKILDERAAQRVRQGLERGDACPVCGGVFSGDSIDNNSGLSVDARGGCKDDDHNNSDGNMDGLETAKNRLDMIRAEVKEAEKNVSNLDTLIKLQLAKIEVEEKKKKELLVRLFNSETEQKRLKLKDESDCARLVKLAESVQDFAAKLARLTAEDDKNESSLVYAGQALEELKTKGTELKNRYDRIAAELLEKGGENLDKRREELAKSLEVAAKAIENGEKKHALLQEETGKLSSGLAEKNKEVSLLEPLIKNVVFDSDLHTKTADLYKELLIEKSALSEQKGAVLQRLSACKEGIEKRKAADVQLKELSKKEDRLDTLKKLFRGDRFLEFVTDEYIGQFAADASVILSGISGGKYSLSYEEGRFYVTDYLSGGKMRTVGTLSGGETFLASLSLASAVARHISLKSYDFFFLDEGFGTLDIKRMDMVADALSGLSRCGMVGVISHRKELTERIPARVRITAATGERGSEITIE